MSYEEISSKETESVDVIELLKKAARFTAQENDWVSNKTIGFESNSRSIMLTTRTGHTFIIGDSEYLHSTVWYDFTPYDPTNPAKSPVTEVQLVSIKDRLSSRPLIFIEVIRNGMAETLVVGSYGDKGQIRRLGKNSEVEETDLLESNDPFIAALDAWLLQNTYS